MTKRRNTTSDRRARTEVDYTAPGVHSKARQVRLPDTLDARLEQHVAMTHTSRSEVMRIALEQYLER
ncbi:MAG: ribbon-helix-helix protein, CopG family [Dermatophilaceae bacterium]